METGSLLTVVKEVKETLTVSTMIDPSILPRVMNERVINLSQVVECLFSQGELLAVLQSISAPHFRPREFDEEEVTIDNSIGINLLLIVEVCMDLEADSAFSSFSSMISQEMEKVRR